MDSPERSNLSPVFVVGPTAVGKTGFALALAEQLDAEIVSADAFQLYAGLDLLTAKPSAEELARVRHHLVGEFPLGERMSAATYAEAARAALAEIAARGRRAIVCGGTGLYIKALTHGLAERPAGDPSRRAELETRPLAELVAELSRLAPRVAAVLDLKNSRRVVRALELAHAGVTEPAAEVHAWKIDNETGSVRGVSLLRSRAEMHARIAGRTAAMFARGVLREVQAAEVAGMGETARQVIGWTECGDCLRGRSTTAEAIERITIATRQYAKRQVTWFKRERQFSPLHLSGGEISEAVSRVAALLVP